MIVCPAEDPSKAGAFELHLSVIYSEKWFPG